MSRWLITALYLLETDFENLKNKVVKCISTTDSRYEFLIDKPVKISNIEKVTYNPQDEDKKDRINMNITFEDIGTLRGINKVELDNNKLTVYTNGFHDTFIFHILKDEDLDVENKEVIPMNNIKHPKLHAAISMVYWWYQDILKKASTHSPTDIYKNLRNLNLYDPYRSYKPEQKLNILKNYFDPDRVWERSAGEFLTPEQAEIFLGKTMMHSRRSRLVEFIRKYVDDSRILDFVNKVWRIFSIKERDLEK